MPFEQHQERTYSHTPDSVYQAALKATEDLAGNLVTKAADKTRLEAKFPKTILGKTVGERTYLSCDVRAQDEGSQVIVDAYPLDALERKLMFGARKGVTQSVVQWFLEHLEQHF